MSVAERVSSKNIEGGRKVELKLSNENKTSQFEKDGRILCRSVRSDNAQIKVEGN